MRIHHREHHATYVKKLNEALSKARRNCRSSRSRDLLSDTDKLPEEIRAAVKNNGGGHFNHDLFWRSMTPRSHRANRAARSATRSARISAPSKRFARSSATQPPNISRAAGSRSSLDARDEKTRHRGSQGSRGAARSRCHRDPHPRRLGARVLPEISESPAGIHRRRSGTSSTGHRPRKSSHDAAQLRGCRILLTEVPPVCRTGAGTSQM